MLARRLHQLDRYSTQFPEQLDELLHDKEWTEQLDEILRNKEWVGRVQFLRWDELVDVTEHLNDVGFVSTPNQSHSSPR